MEALRILYINPSMFEKAKTYYYYRGLYDGLKYVSQCYFYDKVFNDISQPLSEIGSKPDAVIFGLCWCDKPRQISGLSKVNIPVICNIHKMGLNFDQKHSFSNSCDLVLTSVPFFEGKFNKPVRLFPYAADIKAVSKRKLFHVGFSGALHGSKFYPEGHFYSDDLRERIQTLLAKTQKYWKCFLKGSDNIKDRIDNYEQYRRTIGHSKVWIATTGPLHDITPRYYEVMASKSLLFCNTIPETYKDILVDGKNCVSFKEDLSDFVEKLRFYLSNREKRRYIVNKAYKDFIEKHTWQKRAEGLCSIIRNMKLTKNT